MIRVLILEDDPVELKIWQLRIKNLFPKAEVLALPCVDRLDPDIGKIEDVGKNFDIIISDIFLAGETSGIEFVRRQSQETQQKIILSSGVSLESYTELAKELNLNCHFIQKPLNKINVQEMLIKVLQKQDKDFFAESTFEETDKVIDFQKKKIRQSMPVFLITGCSSGVGESLAKLLLMKKAYRLVLTARPKSLALLRERFREDCRVMILPLDLTNESQIQETVLQVLKRWGRIDVLVNNAGLCYRSVVEQMDMDSEESQMKTNYLGPMALIRSVMSVMRENGRGKIINVSSVSGIMGMPTMASYSASKHALEGASESLWYEMKPFGINVTVVRPGFVNNEGHSHVASADKARLAEILNGPYSDFYVFMKPFVSFLMKFSLQNSDAVAIKIMKIIKTQNPPLWVNATFDAYLFSFLKSILPATWFYKLMNQFFLRAAKWGEGYSKADKRRLIS